MRRSGDAVRHHDQRLAHLAPNTDRINASNPCSEYMFLDDTACNLASLNLMKFVQDDGEFDVEAFRYAARGHASRRRRSWSTTPATRRRAIEENSHRFRPLGLGYANLGALLMARGLAYDSDEGRAYAAAITALMHGEAYRHQRGIARDHGGPFAGYDAEPRAVPAASSASTATRRTRSRPQRACRRTLLAGAQRGLGRGARARHAARLPQRARSRCSRPTGTIGVHDGLRHDRHRAGHRARQVQEARRRRATLKIVNQTVPLALRKLGYATGRGRGDRRLRRREGDHRGRARPQARAPAGVRLRVQARQRRAARSTTWATSG